VCERNRGKGKKRKREGMTNAIVPTKERKKTREGRKKGRKKFLIPSLLGPKREHEGKRKKEKGKEGGKNRSAHMVSYPIFHSWIDSLRKEVGKKTRVTVSGFINFNVWLLLEKKEAGKGEGRKKKSGEIRSTFFNYMPAGAR